MFKFKPLPIINFKTKHNQVFSAPWKHGQIFLSGQPCLCVPYEKFVSQGLSNWLEWFINIPGIEDEIEQWATSLSSKGSTIMFDVMRAKGWKNIICDDEPQTSLHLGFCRFVDWFNSKGNQILGKQRSMGVIALNCLNLPTQLRFQPYYTCLSGMIPSPKQSDMFTTNNVLKALVDELLNLHKSIEITPPKYPHVRKIFVRLVGLIGNVVATHKAAGFMSHSAKQFCSWYEINYHE
ncbi:hypothetical protein O181_053578 [Austropuccinia psidii MF-1]|uniref:Uncharacterized protein n=1 Tax=Austropuccinia psidii MF-1 TaxID=1389203 RepID=A0A9Q3HQJ4_9BASI|nr:hypothetical protein [Austropuccinia psidii MF-1]